MSADPPPLTAEQTAQAAVLWRALEGVWDGGSYVAIVTHHRDGHLSVQNINSRRIDIWPASAIISRSTT
jgi:hypothetical protein